MKDLDFDQHILPVERASGVQWWTETDSCEFQINTQEKTLTRRGIWSNLSPPFKFLFTQVYISVFFCNAKREFYFQYFLDIFISIIYMVGCNLLSSNKYQMF